MTLCMMVVWHAKVSVLSNGFVTGRPRFFLCFFGLPPFFCFWKKMHAVQLELCGFQSNGVMELVVVSK